MTLNGHFTFNFQFSLLWTAFRRLGYILIVELFIEYSLYDLEWHRIAWTWKQSAGVLIFTYFMGCFHWVWQDFTTQYPLSSNWTQSRLNTITGARQADGAPSWDAKGVEGDENGKGSPSPADYGIWESVISSPGGVRPKKGFDTFLVWKNTWQKLFGVWARGMSPAPFGSATDGGPLVKRVR